MRHNIGFSFSLLLSLFLLAACGKAPNEKLEGYYGGYDSSGELVDVLELMKLENADPGATYIVDHVNESLQYLLVDGQKYPLKWKFVVPSEDVGNLELVNEVEISSAINMSDTTLEERRQLESKLFHIKKESESWEIVIGEGGDQIYFQKSAESPHRVSYRRLKNREEASALSLQIFKKIAFATEPLPAIGPVASAKDKSSSEEESVGMTLPKRADCIVDKNNQT